MKCPRCEEFGVEVEMIRQQGVKWDPNLKKVVRSDILVCPRCGHSRGKE